MSLNSQPFSIRGMWDEGSAYNLHIGDNSQQANRNLPGVVDDVRIYDRPLSAEEVAGLAGQTKP